MDYIPEAGAGEPAVGGEAQRIKIAAAELSKLQRQQFPGFVVADRCERPLA